MPALELNKARKVYGADEAQVVALDDVSLTVALAQEKSERLCGEVRELTRGESVPKFLETRFEPIEYL